MVHRLEMVNAIEAMVPVIRKVFWLIEKHAVIRLSIKKLISPSFL